MKNENNPQNNPLSQFGDKLAQWKPGQSGNPAGRPKGSRDGIDAHCRRLLAKDLSFSQFKDKLKAKGIDLEDETNAEAISVVLVLKALTGDLKAIEMLCKFELDLPDGADDPTLPPRINITLVQAEGSTKPPPKTINFLGKEHPAQVVKKNVNGNGEPVT